MASFRSNLNSVSSTHGGLIALKNRINTCFKHWRRKLLQPEQYKQKPDYNNHESSYENWRKRDLYLFWQPQGFKETQVPIKTSDNLRSLNKKLEKILPAKNLKPQRQAASNNKIEIVNELLLSSTLLETETKKNTKNTNSFIEQESTAIGKIGQNRQNTSDMTITEDTFVLIREEYPDLDAEVRGILISRAQTGATIGQIKEDYRKNTGMNFPVYDNITDFLLCIPGVMAFCSEHGTRIFNIQPTDKNKHIYNMVMNQKAPSERSASSANNNKRYESRPRESGFHSFRSNAAPPVVIPQAPAPWHSNYYRSTEQSLNIPIEQQQQQYHQHIVDPNYAHSEQSNGSYRDNCEHLFNRIYNNNNEQNKENINWNNNDKFNINFNIPNIPPITTTPIEDISNINRESLPLSDQQFRYQNENHLFKRPMGRAIRSIRASSPSGTHSNQTTDSLFSSDMEYEAHLLDFPLLGDDFFLYLARMELKCKFKKFEKVLQSGLCVSGQTIKAATRRLSRLPFNNFPNRRVIVNIGSVDIMQGKPLVQIEHDYRNLINMINRRGMQPILTTLAPLANYTHDSQIKSKLERFNEFIKREGQHLLVIDIWARFVNERKQTLFDCYQSEPRQVTGAKESYVFWNKIGRQRVLQLVESKLEY